MVFFGDRNWLLAGLLLAGLCLGGCGGGAQPKGEATSQAAASSIKRRPADSLPAVGDYLPPMDEGRIEIAPPAKWNAMPRDARYLARFVHGKASELPRITIEAWDTPLTEINELTEANAQTLAAELVKQLRKDKKTVPEPPKPIVLGDTLFLRHVRRARLPSGDHVVVQALETVRSGRLYSIELIANIDAPRAEEYEASLTKWRDAGYAVAANLKFGGSTAPPAEGPAESTPPAERPAEGTPAESNPVP
jgi:hypothetical protein